MWSRSRTCSRSPSVSHSPTRESFCTCPTGYLPHFTGSSEATFLPLAHGEDAASLQILGMLLIHSIHDHDLSGSTRLWDNQQRTSEEPDVCYSAYQMQRLHSICRRPDINLSLTHAPGPMLPTAFPLPAKQPWRTQQDTSLREGAIMCQDPLLDGGIVK